MLHTNIDIKHSPNDDYHLKPFNVSQQQNTLGLSYLKINDTYLEKMENTALSKSEQWELSTFVVS